MHSQFDDEHQYSVGDTFMLEVNPIYGPRLQRVTVVIGLVEDGSYEITCVDAEWADQASQLMSWLGLDLTNHVGETYAR